jgi:carboxypeptidase Q
MNEENGLAGGLAYAKDFEADLARHVAAIEMDVGAFGFRGFGISAGEGGFERARETIGPLLAPLGDVAITKGGSGADIGPLSRKGGVPSLSLDSDSETYFRYHHTAADTLDKVDPAELARHAAGYAVMAYALAEMEQPLPRLTPGAERNPRR